MRILACADQHGRPDRIARVRALISELRPNVVVLPGDLTHAGSGSETLALLALPFPVLAVPGNMDYATEAARIRTEGRLGEADPVIIDGVSFGGPDVTRPCDVLVVHEPPLRILDTGSGGRHFGTTRVRDLIHRLHPRVVLCGHVHESPGIERSGDTLVVNCTMGDGKTGGALVELTASDTTARLL
jgi:Icc-related predicted phosphoesterase